MNRFVLLSVLMGLSSAVVRAQDTAPATAPAPAQNVSAPAAASAPCTVPTTASAPASQPAQADPQALAILQMLQDAGARYQGLRADLVYTVVMRQLGDSEQRRGYVAYRYAAGEQPSMFRVHFDSLKLGEGAARKEAVDYAFDGYDFIIAKHKIKEMTFLQVAVRGQPAQPMKFGEGPFPLPFGQKVADVLARCDAFTDGATQAGPPGTLYLRLAPRSDQADQVGFVRLEMWVDPKTALPVQLVSEDPSKNITTVEFTKIQIDPELPARTFRMEQGQFGVGWQYHHQRFEEAGAIEP